MKALRNFIAYAIILIALVTFVIWLFMPNNVKKASGVFIRPYYIHTLKDTTSSKPVHFPIDISTYPSSIRDTYVNGKFYEQEDTTTYLKENDYTLCGWVLVDKGDRLASYVYGSGKYVMVTFYARTVISRSGQGKEPIILFNGVLKSRDELYTLMRQVGIIKPQIQ